MVKLFHEMEELLPFTKDMQSQDERKKMDQQIDVYWRPKYKVKWKLSAAKLIYSLEEENNLYADETKKPHGASVWANRNKENVSTIKYYFM